MLQKCNLLCQKKKTLYKMKRYHLEVPLPVSFYAASISLITNNFMYLGIGESFAPKFYYFFFIWSQFPWNSNIIVSIRN